MKGSIQRYCTCRDPATGRVLGNSDMFGLIAERNDEIRQAAADGRKPVLADDNRKRKRFPGVATQ